MIKPDFDPELFEVDEYGNLIPLTDENGWTIEDLEENTDEL